GKGSVAVILIENVGSTRQLIGDLDRKTDNSRRFAEVTYQDVEVTIMVIVHECPGHAPGILASYTRPIRNIFETAILKIVVKPISSVVEKIEIGIAVIVVIAPQGLHGRAFELHSRLFGYIDEIPLVVAIESSTRLGYGIRHKKIEPTVSVKIGKSRTGSYEGNDIFFQLLQ